MPAASNASPIIMLAKIGRLRLLKEIYATVFIPPIVKIESVDRGKELGAHDALQIERAINEGWIKVIKFARRRNQMVQRLVKEAKTGFGEAGALTLAKDKKTVAILDDKEARAIAKSWDLEYTSTVMLLYEAFIRKLINYDEFVEDLAKLTKVMWISTDVITEVIKRAKKVMK